ncbi:MAG TPA: serine/threonine-protein kinase [Thermoanaerobaculia bacterium]|nr:serine/threonine-protein kinase [Thermoanaerobaculia bacterium]
MQLGPYRLISRLGAGGMGEVWRAEDTKLLRQVAIKILPAALAADQEWKDRFLREARTIAQVTHPNIATIYAIDEIDDTLFIAMELIEGEPVSAMIARGPLIPLDAVRIAAHVADGLSEAHEKGIVHRDIKPDNILVSPRFVKVLDFGIAKHVGGTAESNLTQANMVIGTPHYMSPEQAMGRTVDRRTDLFSLGVVMYEMLSGKKPFTGEAVTETLLKIVTQDPIDIAIAAAMIPKALAEIVRRCMAKMPDHRFANCDQLRKALVRSLREDPNRARQSSVPTISLRKKSGPQQQADVQTRPEPRRFEPEPAPRAAVSARPHTPPERQQPPEMPPPPRPVMPAGPVEARATGDRALVADDDPTTRYLLTSVLQKYRIPVDEVDNGADAVKCLKEHQYSLIFVDLLMPRVDGWGVIDYVRNHRGTRSPRLFVVTGVQDQKLSAADQDVVTALLYKPVDVVEIERIVTA